MKTVTPLKRGPAEVRPCRQSGARTRPPRNSGRCQCYDSDNRPICPNSHHAWQHYARPLLLQCAARIASARRGGHCSRRAAGATSTPLGRARDVWQESFAQGRRKRRSMSSRTSSVGPLSSSTARRCRGSSGSAGCLQVGRRYRRGNQRGCCRTDGPSWYARSWGGGARSINSGTNGDSCTMARVVTSSRHQQPSGDLSKLLLCTRLNK